MKNTQIIIENANNSHLKDIKNILNHFILTSEFNLNTSIKTDEDILKWYNERIKNNHPIIIALIKDEVVGWASLSKFRNIDGYNKTAEISLYIKTNFHKRGIGSMLLTKIEELAKKNNLHSLVSIITSNNIASIKLHEKFNFEKKAIFNEIAIKNNNYIDVCFLYKII